MHWLQYQGLNVERRLIEALDHLPNRAEAITTPTICNNRILYRGVATMQTFQSSMHKQPRKECTTAMWTIWTTEIILEAYLANFQIILIFLVGNTLNHHSSRLGRNSLAMHHSEPPSLWIRGVLREQIHTCKRTVVWQIRRDTCQMLHAQLAIGWGSKTKFH